MVKIGSARSTEYSGSGWDGKAKAGDQTGKEVSTQDWYLHSKGWIVLRPKRTEAAELIARNMEYACNNNLIGYDQSQRDTLYNVVKDVNFNCSRVSVKCETDCSALVRVCINYAGIPLGNIRTADMVAKIMTTGQFDKFTDDKHCKSSDYLKRGDILVTRTSGHTVVVLSDGSKTEAKEVKASGVPASFNKSYAGRYTVTASWLNVRDKANTMSKVLVTIPKGTKVYTYGYYTKTLGTVWYWSEVYYNGIKYTAFVSSRYLKR